MLPALFMMLHRLAAAGMTFYEAHDHEIPASDAEKAKRPEAKNAKPPQAVPGAAQAKRAPVN